MSNLNILIAVSSFFSLFCVLCILLKGLCRTKKKEKKVDAIKELYVNLFGRKYVGDNELRDFANSLKILFSVYKRVKKRLLSGEISSKNIDNNNNDNINLDNTMITQIENVDFEKIRAILNK